MEEHFKDSIDDVKTALLFSLFRIFFLFDVTEFDSLLDFLGDREKVMLEHLHLLKVGNVFCLVTLGSSQDSNAAPERQRSDEESLFNNQNNRNSPDAGPGRNWEPGR